MPSGLEDSRGDVSAMRVRLGFSLVTSSEGSHSGGRAVRTERNEGERESAKARGAGCPGVTHDKSLRGSITTFSKFGQRSMARARAFTKASSRSRSSKGEFP